jgi:PrtD family type I secretion system ABC transporter
MIKVPVETKLSTALHACRKHFLWAAFFSALLNLLFIAPMLYMLQVYDRVVPTQGTATLLFLTAVLVAALATLSLLDYVRSRLLVRASARLDGELSGAILDATLAQSGSAAPHITRRAVREFDTLRQTLSGAGVLALFDAPWTPIYILICFIIHPLVGLLATTGSGLLLLMAWLNEKSTRDPLQRANEAAGEAYVSHDQSTAVADVVRALGMRRAMVGRHIQERQAMISLQTKASFDTSKFVAGSKFLRLLLQSLALGLGALLAINNQITGGAIFASMFLVGRALAPIDQLLGAWKSIIQARNAYATLAQLFAAAPLDLAKTQLPPPVGRLDVEHLTVGAPGRIVAILQDVSLRVAPGEAIAIIGPSGAGKSTLTRLFAGAGFPDGGSIRFDGVEQKDWDPERLSHHVGYMPQDPTLFAGTIKENIARFKTSLNGDLAHIDAAVVEAAQRAGAHDLIVRLPNGYDYRLALGGRGLSTGQAQRIALARALFGSPRYLFLDEPNAHLDAEGDLQLLSTLGEAKKAGTTILVVAHKLSILPIIDKLLVLREGNIEMFGPRDEVMRRLSPARPPQAVPQPKAKAAL